MTTSKVRSMLTGLGPPLLSAALGAAAMAAFPSGPGTAGDTPPSAEASPDGGDASDYWTEERMREARPAMPLVPAPTPGEPPGASAQESPAGAPEGAPGRPPAGTAPPRGDGPR
jgi:hypothetical protein